MSWTELGKPEDPVRGNIDQFDAAVTQWRGAKEKATQIQQDFSSILSGGDVGLTGQAADAFRTLVSDAAGVLTDVPAVFGSMETVLSDHVRTLREYKAEADSALARAKVAQQARAAAASANASSRARIGTLESQIAALQNLPPDQQATSEITTLQQKLAGEKTFQTSKSREAADQQAVLTTELAKWDTLRTKEDELNKGTSQKLDHFDLKSLRDPGWLEQQWNNFKDWCIELGEDFYKFLQAAISGDWEAALWYLRDVLEKVLDVLTIVLAIVAIVATIVSLGTLAPLLISAVLVLSSLKLVITGTLLLYGIPHPETGQRLGIADLAYDAVDVALAALSFKAAAGSWGKSTVVFGKGHAYNAGRNFLKDQFGVSFKNGYNVSIKQTAKNLVWSSEGPGIIFKGSDAYNMANGFDGGGVLDNQGLRDDLQGVGPDGSAWSGSEGSRLAPINQEIQLISSGQRGLSQPCQVIMIDATY